MPLPHFSIKSMLGAIVLVAVGLCCLLNASSPWAGAALTCLLIFLTMAPLGIAYRRGGDRAFWVGATVCGWSYLLVAIVPWPGGYLGPRLLSTVALKMAYPLVIPEEHQASNERPKESFVLASPEYGEDIEPAMLGQFPLDVLAPGEDRPSLVAEGVAAVGWSGGGKVIQQLTIAVESALADKLRLAGKVKFIIRRHPVSRFARILAGSPPVNEPDFVGVGHACCGLLCTIAGGVAGRYFQATSDTAA